MRFRICRLLKAAAPGALCCPVSSRGGYLETMFLPQSYSLSPESISRVAPKASLISTLFCFSVFLFQSPVRSSLCVASPKAPLLQWEECSVRKSTELGSAHLASYLAVCDRGQFSSSLQGVRVNGSYMWTGGQKHVIII